ncbi:phosphoribosylglycinamide formyltransferase [Heyndrickxia acidicola]|uniref:Phosphoribosylglycinamide formyltransferase n=1 Tax=Heyndrickxia acidicola TaxID=209389 RepID=A0ABU6MDZ2_9BACI|nr:phosphoribosylglycinamide formyltransferase [Heyndrickxia acidicola]MED1202659.1 phosphoribosylglycinamide formyltransferase [Heyndrickxia acidicola]
MMKIAIFASGSGSNFQAIQDEIKKGRLDASVELLVCDRKEAFVIERALQAQVPVFSFNPKEYGSKEEFETEIAEELRKRDVELLVLAGYMRLIGPTLLRAYPGRIVNIHPSLLPSFPGKDAISQAISAGVKVTGVTVHFVDEGMDTGPIIAQEAVSIFQGEGAEDVAAKIHAVEHRLYPEVLGRFTKDVEFDATGRFTRMS